MFELLVFLGLGGLLWCAIIYSAWAWAVVAGSAFTWFIHPMFPWLHEPSLAQFIGIIAMLQVMLPKQVSGKSGDNDESGGKRIAISGVGVLIAPWVSWTALWLLSQMFVPGVYTP